MTKEEEKQKAKEMKALNKIKIFENKKIRTAWNEDEGEWYFSVVDIIEVLTDSDRPRKYWNDLKKKLLAEGSELSEKIGQLKMMASDGKMRETDVLDSDGIILLAKNFPNNNGSDFLDWFLYSENSVD